MPVTVTAGVVASNATCSPNGFSAGVFGGGKAGVLGGGKLVSVGGKLVSVAKPSVVVVGNEGAGLRTNVRRACNRAVRIEGGGGGPTGVGDGDTVDSLNVSVAAGILLHSMLSSSRARRV